MENLKPQYLKDFIGQSLFCENLKIYIKSCNYQEKNLDHIILFGESGNGKTTLATIIANEMKSKMISISSPNIEKNSDLISILLSLNNNDILFIDEIHRLKRELEEILYEALDKKEITIIVDKDSGGDIVTIPIQNFTLIGATTKPGLISKPLFSRFPISYRFETYTIDELANIVMRNSKIMNLEIPFDIAKIIASRGKYNPRLINNILFRIKDFSIVKKQNKIDLAFIKDIFRLLQLGEFGLTKIDFYYLDCLHTTFNNGPVGINSLSLSLNEDITFIEENIEPYLIKMRLIERTIKGRILTKSGIAILNKH